MLSTIEQSHGMLYASCYLATLFLVTSLQTMCNLVGLSAQLAKLTNSLTQKPPEKHLRNFLAVYEYKHSDSFFLGGRMPLMGLEASYLSACIVSWVGRCNVFDQT